ncbi:discoidin domain-containing receptor 2-like isoform X2 [Microplitis mediator]|uniref:discoidin domain-containing receptor 2-like isoform X2 n=1 Tax=Microplitis mediator TaxID=375433 RepID=UPI0025572026|nr:discoidin domain-containing receptor 2-like isoform X2 [Microplitis mediator]
MRNTTVRVNLFVRIAVVAVVVSSIVPRCYSAAAAATAVAAAAAAEHQIKNASAQCVLPLGMEEGKIPDDAISASSSYETKSVGPQNARIRQEKNGGAWCPKAQISNDIREYLEIDLTTDHLITWTETQGRFGNGQGQEYAEAFFLEYWRDSKWHQYKTLKGDRILRGNSNTYLVERQKLELPFVASRVRFVPYSQHPRTVCMRVEIYGCIWEQRIVKYKIPRGVAFGPGGSNVEDTSYDGRTDVDRKYLIGGLGQLVDGMLGEDPRVSSSLAHWVGWTDINPVPVVFEFTDTREFNVCIIYSANAPVRGIEVFKNIKVWFSKDGIDYDSSPIEMTIEEKSPYSPGIIPILVSLKSRVGRFVKLELEPRSKWLLISEISFESLTGSRSGNSSDERLLDTASSAVQNDSITTEDPGFLNGEEFNVTDSEVNGNQTPDASPVGPRWSQTYIGLVSGALTVLALLLTCTVVLMKLRGRNKVALLQKHTALLCGSTAPGITINVKDLKLPTPIVVNGTQSRLTGSLKGSSSKLRSGSMSSYDAATLMREHIQQSHSCDMSSEYEHRSVYAESTYKLLFPEERFNGCKTDYADVAEFATESANAAAVSTSSSAPAGCGSTSGTSTTVALPEAEANERPQPQTPYAHRSSKHHGYSSKGHKVYEGYYAATDILTIKRREQHTGSSLFTSLLIEDYHNHHQHHHQHYHHQHNVLDNYDIQHISRHRLRILDKIGEGSFGFVHLCEAKGIHSPDLGTIRNRQLVIVRSLWRGVTDSLKKDFMRDMYVLAKIRDPNITRIVALVEEEPFGAVFEYGELGDLPDFIRNREKSDNEAPLSYNRLLKFITHIASGMRYLESLNIAHCDLAARNCVVGKNLSIKVSDHAMYCSKYDSEYYVNECYTKIPLRWMAWEAVLLGKRSCQADVWSYATTVWEILTYCEDLPFSDMTSEQVLENCGNWYNSTTTSTTTSSSSLSCSSQDKKTRVLSQPATCSRDLYRMMTKCWSKHAEERPSFEDIYVFLKRLTLNE